MLLSEIKSKIHPKLYSKIRGSFEEFRPCQEKAIELGLLEGEDFLVCTPTASGKTLVAEMGALNSILKKKGPAIYIVPLRSLAAEKYREFKENYAPLGVNVGMSIGDFDSSDEWLRNYDLIILTIEKLDSILRHQAPWINEVATVVVDEIHLLNDVSRGPTLEILITLLRKLLPKMQLIALSATIGNSEVLSKWLGSKLIEDDWRPIKLFQGTYFNNKINFHGEKEDKKVVSDIPNSTIQLAMDTVKSGQQALIFCPTKKSTEATAERISKLMKESAELKKESEKILKALSRPTRQCKRLKKCFSKQVAFHHAGLVSKQRHLIEDKFRDKKTKIICCTPTLAFGLDMPADRVIMKSLKRFDGRRSSWIPVLEFMQMTGRAGRPGKSKQGLAVSVANSKNAGELIYEKYIRGEPEPIRSKLGVETVLRTHLLSLIASGFVKQKEEILKFFEKSLYGFQYGNDWSFELKIEDIVEMLEKYGFIKSKGEQVRPTKIGKRISELYIDPVTAWNFIKSIKKVSKKNAFSILQMISDTTEMRPLIRAKKKDGEEIEEFLIENEDKLIKEPPKEWDWNYPKFINSVKTTMFFLNWINEESEEYLLEKFGVRPGEIRSRLINANWLLYSCSEIARLLDLRNVGLLVNKIRLRVKHGIKEELIPLVKIRGVGRRRARLLYNAGWKKPSDIKKSTPQKIAMILHSAKIGKKVWERVKGEKYRPNSKLSEFQERKN